MSFMTENEDKIFWLLIYPVVVIMLFVFLISVCSCTLSFQNISTHGVAEDLVEETQSPSNDISTQLQGLPH
jgi:ABC-type sugar transport system permease subunit